MTLTPTLAFRLVGPAALALALGGCVSLGGGKAPPTLFTITAAAAPAAGQAVNGNADSALVVLDPETDRVLGVQRVAVTIDAANVAYLKDAMWAERPARLFRHLLAETLRAKGGRLVFEDAEAAASGRARLAGRLLAFGYDAPSHAAVVRYDAVREGPGGAVATRRFEASVPVTKADARRLAPALNQAANAVAAQVADWVG
ncbi:ABC-type transport auxiliary lipoprotein family protein [Novosphingobium bradum]|uniref:ABC-type transport auxiliary lipoprotein family protein n=1 Tax=Novosphingobium bradum TaxID=1737444 RepID=A0ABV7IME5_9SPHN